MNSFIIFLPLLVLMICFVIRLPIGLGMIISCAVYFVGKGMSLGIIADTVMSQLYASTVMIAIPLFIFTANIMSSGKVTEYMFTFVKAILGKRKGALAHLNIILSLIFSGMTGSAAADAAGLGTIEIEEMKKDGYDMPFSAAITAATATVGPIFPPSIPLVIYSMFAQVSVGKLFFGGMIPAVLICVILGIYVSFLSKKRNYPEGISFTRKKFWTYTLRALPALFTPVILLGGIYTGIVTATEAGALAALYTILISFLAYRVLSMKGLVRVIKDTVIQTGKIFSVVIGAYLLSYYATTSGLGKIISTFTLGLTDNKYVFLLIVNVLFLLLGMLFDTNVLEFVFFPLLIPVAKALGVDLVHLGVVLTVNMMIGSVTPPFGMMCFISAGIANEKLTRVFKEVLPMAGLMIVVLILITYFPAIITFVPNLIMG